MTAERTIQGAWKISALVNGYLVTRQYFDYTKKEAIAEFKREMKELSKKKNPKRKRKVGYVRALAKVGTAKTAKQYKDALYQLHKAGRKSNPLARAIPARLIPEGKGGYRVFVNAKRAGMVVRNPKGKGKGKGKRQLDVFDTHMLRIARQTLRYNDVGANIMGGPTKAEARETIRRIGGGEAEIRRLEK